MVDLPRAEIKRTPSALPTLSWLHKTNDLRLGNHTSQDFSIPRNLGGQSCDT